ncbi:MAG: hypothetical protein QOG10_6540 [Kribbellaceae bacterium]|jgi:hypothetical protein|nr:hypothetical protein [Kribbellaceae bacterium]
MTLHHVSHGEGTPVLAIHGWTPDHRLMTGCLEPIFESRLDEEAAKFTEIAVVR